MKPKRMELYNTLVTREFQKAHEDFDRLVRSKGYKTGQGTTYQFAVKEFLRWMESKNFCSLQEVTTENCEYYYGFLISRNSQQQRGATLSDASINHHLFGLRLFVDHLSRTQEIRHAVAIAPNHVVKQKKRDVLSKEEIQLLYAATTSPMQVALLSLTYGCGLRRQELCKLKINDIAFQSGMLIVRHGKGNKTREIPMSETVRAHLRHYADRERVHYLLKKEKFCPQFLITPQGNPVTGLFLARMLKTIVSQTGVQKLTDRNINLHFLRHCIATHLSESGAEIEFIREFLGHSTTDTSSIYMVRRKRMSKYLI